MLGGLSSSCSVIAATYSPIVGSPTSSSRLSCPHCRSNASPCASSLRKVVYPITSDPGSTRRTASCNSGRAFCAALSELPTLWTALMSTRAYPSDPTIPSGSAASIKSKRSTSDPEKTMTRLPVSLAECTADRIDARLPGSKANATTSMLPCRAAADCTPSACEVPRASSRCRMTHARHPSSLRMEGTARIRLSCVGIVREKAGYWRSSERVEEVAQCDINGSW
mmetsp:Transcript_39125/g.94287  ORF Transcript_39125/g.94287 Transcript_39125/m.94287 type:complete len:224 (-) Transcript_39125:382-1053(-)